MKFADLNLHEKVAAGVAAAGFEHMTPIQEQAIPLVIKARDVAGLAQTGTGKTAAFLLPLMDRILRSREAAQGDVIADDFKVRVFADWKPSNYILVLVPTRELAEQVLQNAKALGEHTGLKAAAVYGGTSYEPQKAAIKEGVEFIVATPGRLIDLFKDHVVDLSQARAVVFDEADRMFDMGFKDDMKYILRRIPRDRQFLVFSATLNFDVLNVAYEFGAEPVEVNIDRDQPKAENVEDEIFHVGGNEKPLHLLSILKKHQPRQAIIFSNFKANVERIAQFLSQNDYPAMGISSLLTQAQRNRVMDQFKAENDRNILVATDVAARGLDIKGVDLVVNYELPDDAENYVHRIGRTGRAGESGKAFSLVSDRDVEALSRIEEYLGHKVAIGWLSDDDLIKEAIPFPESSRRDSRSRPPRKDRPQGRGPRGRRTEGHKRSEKDRRPRRPGTETARADSPRGPREEAAPRLNGSEPVAQGSSQSRRRRRRKKPSDIPRRDEHRDRATGRHRTKGNGEDKSARAEKPSHPHRRRGQAAADRFEAHAKSRRRSQPRSSVPAAKGVTGKVSGFFKKLFGG